MKNMFKLLFILFLLPLTIAANGKEGKYTKNKIINKEFKVDKNATLKVDNKYGNIEVVTWNENKIVIKVTITTSGNDEEKVQKKLDQINVEFSNSDSKVSAKTIIDRNSSWKLWRNNNNVNMQINYLIKMPVTNNVVLTNNYGSINLDKLEGVSTINCDYGSINIGELRNSDNTINIDYTNNSFIDFMKDGKINADYSTLSVNRSGRTTLNADYSHITFGQVIDLKYNCDYGSLKIGDSGNITGVCDYMHTTIGKLRGRGDFNIEYGSLKIKEIQNQFKSLKVVSSYTHLKFGIAPNTSFNISAHLSYSGLKYNNDKFNFTKQENNFSQKKYEGYYNEDNSGKIITIKSSYGSVTFL
ncbi:hypothetical protein [Lutibacter sp.]|uniref:hypothetical protein n=1 Tax=Lutibacter sp. TaxID=1925666 RepID=UPI0025C647AA|nr:hypothetical protein [Lutibacter sp.]MCF6181122.1 hypothetical protein [Lutibacter sp.]